MANTIVVTAADPLGNRSNPATLSVTLDTTGPTLSIGAPADGVTLASATPTVTYATGDAASWTFTLSAATKASAVLLAIGGVSWGNLGFFPAAAFSVIGWTCFVVGIVEYYAVAFLYAADLRRAVAP